MAASLNDYPVAIVNNLKLTLDNLAQTLQNETAYWAVNGPKPSYTLSKNGASRQVSWTEWLREMNEQIKELNATIVAMDQPYELNTRYYT